ncbi:MAG: flagellar filament capping protein FliD [Desulfovibrio sp.]|jgi:flagellar hook-associated protein 2|nr:flagellar filament capping protein FliD [Desulfovibrio sp.]
MASTISGSTAISGLGGAGTDFDAVLQQLRAIERTQIKRMENWKSDWNLRYQAFGQIIDQVKAAKGVLDALSNRNNFIKKNIVSSNVNVVSAVASANAQDVQHSIEVKQVASNAIWANTGHVFSSKTDSINTSGAAQDFSYRYAGKDYTVSVPKNTTLESFMYMVNNAVDNPGVQVSLVQTGSGYVFQIAGKQTGVANDLVVYNADLVGMNAAGSTTTWRTNALLDPNQAVTNPTSFIYDIVLENGVKRSVNIKGDATREELADAINAQIMGFGAASVDGSGNLVMDGVKSVTRRDANASSGTPVPQGNLSSATTTLTFDPAKLNDALKDGDVYTLTNLDGSYSTFKVDALNIVRTDFDSTGTQIGTDTSSGATNGILRDAVADAAGLSPPYPATLTLTNVQGFAQTTGTGGMGGMTVDVQAVTTMGAGYFLAPSYTLETPPNLAYNITRNDGTTVNVTLPDGSPLPSGSAMSAVFAAFEDALGAGNVKYVDGNGNDVTPPPPLTGPVYLELSDILDAYGPGISGQMVSSSNWSIQNSSNAVYRIDNWPMDMESASNNVTDVIEGVVFDIQEAGTARISVSTDIASVEESIQYFLDAVNSVLVTIRDLTKFDADKQVTSLDPNDSNYSPSQLTSEKGGLLQGNYGVQLFKTRFSSLLTSSPPGFQSRATASSILSGDMIATLSAMGIKTCTDESDSNYGLLVIAPASGIQELQTLDQEHYNDMITNHLQDVVDFFCTSGEGTSTSADFRYGSHIEGITKAGSYTVEYTVTSGNIDKVFVGGVEAKRDTSMPGYYYSVDKGDAAGLSIVIDNLADGAHTGQVRIKQGLVQTIDRFFKDELVYTDVNISADDPVQAAAAIELKSKNGALMVLQANYLEIMKGIDVKIAREEKRIELWETRQKNIFANLETLLKQYSQQQKELESQLAQLSTSE